MNIKFKLDPEFRALNRPLNKSEYSGLEQSIMVRGCDHPLVVWRGLLLDGHHRYEICQKHGIKFKTTEAPPYVKTREDAKRYIIIEGQLARRNLTNYQKCVLAMKLEPFIAEEAKRRRREAGKLYGRGHPKKKVTQHDGKAFTVDNEIGELAGCSGENIRKVRKIEALADKKTKAKLRAGDTTIRSVWLKMRNIEVQQQPPETTDEPEVEEIEEETIEQLSAQEWKSRLTRIISNILEARIQLKYLVPESDLKFKSDYKPFFETPVIKSATEQVKFFDLLCDELNQIHSMVEEIEREYKR